MLMTINTQYVRFVLPPAVQTRLNHLLDKQDTEKTLSETERQEAAGLVKTAEFLSLHQLHSERVEQEASS